MAAQRGVDLAEPLGAGVAEGGDQFAEAVELAAHLRPDGIEVGADDVLAGVEPGLQAAGGLVEVAAIEHVDLAQSGGDGGIALVEVPLVEVIDGRRRTSAAPTPRRRGRCRQRPGGPRRRWL